MEAKKEIMTCMYLQHWLNLVRCPSIMNTCTVPQNSHGSYEVRTNDTIKFKLHSFVWSGKTGLFGVINLLRFQSIENVTLACGEATTNVTTSVPDDLATRVWYLLINAIFHTSSWDPSVSRGKSARTYILNGGWEVNPIIVRVMTIGKNVLSFECRLSDRPRKIGGRSWRKALRHRFNRTTFDAPPGE